MILKNLPLPVKVFVRELRAIDFFKIGYSKKRNCLKFYSEPELCTYYFYLDSWISTEFLDSDIVQITFTGRKYEISLVTGMVYITC